MIDWYGNESVLALVKNKRMTRVTMDGHLGERTDDKLGKSIKDDYFLLNYDWRS